MVGKINYTECPINDNEKDEYVEHMQYDMGPSTEKAADDLIEQYGKEGFILWRNAL